MSTDYEIRCSCGGRFSQDNWRKPEHVAVLVESRDAFAAIGKKVGPLNDFWLDGWNAFGSMFPRIFDFFAVHEGEEHVLTIYDEYGSRWPECTDGKHDVERVTARYAKCKVCVWRDFTEQKP